MLIKLVWRELITDSAQRDFLLCRNGLSYLQRRHRSLTCCSQLALLWNTSLLLLLCPLHLSSLLLSWVWAESSTSPAPPLLLCSLSRVLSASDSSIHEKCDVSRSSATRWRCRRPPTHGPGAARVRGMSLSRSLRALIVFLQSWPSVQPLFPGFSFFFIHLCLWAEERTMNLSSVCCE